MAHIARIKPRAEQQTAMAAQWWLESRPGAPGAIRKDLKSALALLVEKPGIGTKVETPRSDVVRRLYLSRIRYFLYYRVQGKFLEVVGLWHASRGQPPSR